MRYIINNLVTIYNGERPKKYTYFKLYNQIEYYIEPDTDDILNKVNKTLLLSTHPVITEAQLNTAIASGEYVGDNIYQSKKYRKPLIGYQNYLILEDGRVEQLEYYGKIDGCITIQLYGHLLFNIQGNKDVLNRINCFLKEYNKYITQSDLDWAMAHPYKETMLR